MLSTKCCYSTLIYSYLTSIFPRSEGHTSELQSQSNLVCRLLLENKTAFPNVSATTQAPPPPALPPPHPITHQACAASRARRLRPAGTRHPEYSSRLSSSYSHTWS